MTRSATPCPELSDEIEAAFTDILPKVMPSLTTTVGVTAGNDGRTETQLQILGEIPLGLGSLYSSLNCLHLLLRGQYDHGNSDLYTGYLGFKFALHSAFTVDAEFRLGTFGGSEPTIFYRRPDLRLDFFWWSKYITLGGAMNLAGVYNETGPAAPFSNPMTTYYLSTMLNIDGWTDNPYLEGLRVGVEYNYFHYFYQGDARARHQVGIGARYENDFGTNWFKLQGSLFGIIYTSEDENGNITTGGGFQGSLGVDFIISRYLFINASYNLQYIPEYPQHIFDLGLGVTF